MPRNIYFHETSTGEYEMGFNGLPIAFSDLLKAKKALDSFIENATPALMEELNREENLQFYGSCDLEGTLPKKSGVKGFIYLIESGGLYKLGRTRRLESRMSTYRTENPHGITFLSSKEVHDYVKYEKRLLEKYKEYQHRGEWFAFPDEILEEVKLLEV